jgi:hypothetical protein
MVLFLVLESMSPSLSPVTKKKLGEYPVSLKTVNNLQRFIMGLTWPLPG